MNATWQNQFWESKTNEDNFYYNVLPQAESVASAKSLVATSMRAHFMHMVERFDYSHDAIPGFQVVRMKYQTSKLSMIVLLPAINYGSIGPVKSEDVLAALPNLTDTKLALAFPKFKFAQSYEDDLMSALKEIGLTAPFQGGFCGMFDGSCPFLSFVKQKTFINVHEKGTEAAAVTAGAVVTMLPPPEQPTLFMANRPFQFLIYDDTADLVLFEGHVGAPDIPEGSVAELEAQHEDEDFWLEHFVEDPIVPDVPVPPTTTSTTQSTPLPSSPQTTTDPSASDQTTSLPATAETTSTPPAQTTEISTTESTPDPFETLSSSNIHKPTMMLTTLSMFALLWLRE
uniref:Serpin domain-containing protein n=1 Tax=Pseudictyota dubia TaxID=2749911 RepID=A0A7R9VLM2_9STRA